MNVQVSRRGLLKGIGVGLAGGSLGALGFGALEPAMAASVRPFKLAQMKETRNTCPYCSVACGIILYSLGDRSKNAKSSVMHVEGDPDHPVNRGTLCPKGSSLLDFIKSETRTKYPMHRTAGSSEFKRVSWDFALDRIATLLKEDRDKNFIAKNGDLTVNRWTTVGFLGASATSNETAWVTYKVIRSMGALTFDNQARV
ncbi:Formate dehydrogenase-O major subunit [Methylobacterium haplocladii]|nr:Formate dehydrogenase-O major subunit [Methylobacterium haplocladii]